MRRAALILIMLVPTGVWAQAPPPVPVAPRAVVRGPSAVLPGGTVILDGRDSVCDPDQPLQWRAIQPADLVLITADKGNLKDAIAFFATASQTSGEYLIGLSAIAVDPTTHRVAVDTAVVRVDSFLPSPPPKPEPIPPPGPRPAPAPAPLPVPTTPLALAAQQYYAGFPGLLRSVGDRLGSGALPDKQSAIAAVSDYTLPLAHALDAAFAGHIDAAGKVTDPAALKAALYDAAAATGGP